MADFWDQFLPHNQPQQPAPQQAQQPGEPVPWWDRTLAPQQPVQQPVPQPQQPVQQTQPQPEQEEGAEAMQRVQWAKQRQETCPSCGSTDYGSHPSEPKARPRCFGCGFPISQSGSGVTLKGEIVGPVKASRQTAESLTNSFNPQNIFHRLG